MGAAVLTAGPATADHGTTSTNAAVLSNYSPTTGEYATRQVFWANKPSCCADIVDAGVNSWDALGRVDWINRSTNPTLRFYPNPSPSSASILGEYVFAYNAPDSIYFYHTNFGDMPQGDKNWLGRHETGHALALKHPYEIQFDLAGNVTNEAQLESAANQRCCVMHTYNNRQDSDNTYKGITYLTDHDRNHHYERWK